MSYDDREQAASDVDRVGQLLKRALPRPAPPADDTRRIRDSVHSEWRALTTRRHRRRWSYVGMAASLVLCAIFVARMTGTDDALPIDVAQIEKRFGSVYLVHEDAGLIELDDLQILQSDLIVQTAKASGLSFVLGDGLSVRLDEDSRIELIAPDMLYLQRGRVYVDAPASGPPIRLTIRADQGSVTHTGTQYMVTIAGDELTVSVRDGEVHIDGRYYDSEAAKGERVTLLGSHRPVVDRLATHGGPWRWTEMLSPRLSIDGMAAGEFLQWVSHETGYRIVYDDAEARRIANNTVLKGVVDRNPLTELQLRLLTMDLAHEIDDARGLIRIRVSGSAR